MKLQRDSISDRNGWKQKQLLIIQSEARHDAPQRLDPAKPVAIGEIPRVRRSNRATR
jgi:hypothetical protein